MKILIIAHFSGIPNKQNNDRFNYIARILSKENEVELITTSFSHRNKTKKVLDKEQLKKLDYKFTTICEPGYENNISLKRIYSHNIMARNLQKYLTGIKEKPDVIYCSVPSLSVAKTTAKYAKKNNIRFIIDIQDLWPEAFKMKFKIPIIRDIIFYPMKKIANYIYKQADDIVAVSDTYLNRAVKVNRKCKNKLSVFLGTELKTFDEYHKKNMKTFNDEYIRLVYIGTVGYSYDLKTIIDVTRTLQEKGEKVKFLIIGKGPLEAELKEYSKGVDVEFIKFLPYGEMIGYLCACDIAINSFIKGASQSITNKIGDYAAAGLPVINTQESKEYRKIVEDYKIGFNCENGNAEDIVNKIEILIRDKEKRKEFGKNNRKLAEEKFDRKNTYKSITDVIVR